MPNRFLNNITINDEYTFPDADGSANQVIATDGSGELSFVDQNVVITVKNVSGGSLSKGTVVHTSPSATPPAGNVIEVIAADYDDATKMPAIGVLNETIADGAEGAAVMMGAVSGIDTSSFSIGDELYVGNLGTFTNSKPSTAGQLIQKIAVVIKSHASNGLIKIFGAGRSNDVPLPLYVDNTNQRVGISEPSPNEKFVVSEVRSGTTAADQTKYTLVSKATISSGTPGTGGIKVAYDDGTTEHGFGLVAGSSSADFLTTGPMHFYTNSDLNTQSATGYAMMIDTSQNVVIGDTLTTSSKLYVNSGLNTALSLKSNSPKIELINDNTTTQSFTTILATAGGGGTSPPKGQIQWRGPSSANSQGLYLQTYNTSSPYTTAEIYLPVATTNGNFHIKLNNLNTLEIDPSTQDVGINQYIYHLGDDDTKFGFVANDNFAIRTAGGERVRVTSGGSVGINTNNPGAKLDVEGNAVIGAAGNIVNGDFAVAINKNTVVTSEDGFAQGENTIATGRQAAAFGFNTYANGPASIAGGSLSETNAQRSIAVGATAITNAEDSAAFNTGTRANGLFSFATGQGCFATNNAAFATGSNTQATGLYSFSGGVNSIASGNGAVALGGGAQCSGEFSFAAGNINVASGINSTALGFDNDAIGAHSTVIGHLNTTSAAAAYGVAINFQNTVSGQGAFAFNQGNTVSGLNAASGGVSNTVTAEASFAYGFGNDTSGGGSTPPQQILLGRFLKPPRDAAGNAGEAQTIVGRYNEHANQSATAFAVGVGTGVGSESNAITALYTGNVGIGTTNPGEKLEVSGNIKTTTATITEGTTVTYTGGGSTYETLGTNVAFGRGSQGAMYNPLLNPGGWSYASRYQAPIGLLFNTDGWSNLTNIQKRNYLNFVSALGNSVGNNIVNTELIMWDYLNDNYYKLKFTAWGQGGAGGYTYQRTPLTINNKRSIATDTISTNKITVGDKINMPSGIRLASNIDMGSPAQDQRADLLVDPAQSTIKIVTDPSDTSDDKITEYRNIRIGHGVGRNIGTGTKYLNSNVLIGHDVATNSTNTNTGCHYNVFIGGFAGFDLGQGTATNNVGVGYTALQQIQGGDYNVGVGSAAGISITSGNSNTFIGRNAGDNLTTGSNNSSLGYGADPSSSSVSNTITLGNSSITTLRCQVTSITSLSDKRDKTNIKPSTYGLNVINKLNPVTFDWNMRDEGKVGDKDLGFIAQDLQEVDDENLKLVYEDNPEKLEASHGRLIPVMTKAIQELSAEIEKLKNEIQTLKQNG